MAVRPGGNLHARTFRGEFYRIVAGCIQWRHRWRTGRTLEQQIDMAAKRFCSQIHGRDKVPSWKPRIVDDPGPGLADIIYHARSSSGAIGFTPALQADVNVFCAADFIEAEGLQVTCPESSAGARQRDD